MRNKIFALSILLIAAALLSACAPQAAQSTPQPPPRTLNVNGSGQIYAIPDMAYISIGVHTENADAGQAVADNTAQAEAIQAALLAEGVAAEDIQTTNFSIYPQDQYSPEGQKTGTIYMVDNSVYVTVRDLDKLSGTLQAAIEAGANSVNGISFDISDKAALQSQAREAAMQDAQSKAQELAQSAGVTLGEVQTISYYSSFPVPVYDYKGGLGGGAQAGAVPISPGQMSVNAEVNVVYEIQ
jgi:hypothetical protein